MKKIFILFILFSFENYAQIILFNFDSDYREAEISFMDGHKESGYIYGFIEDELVNFDFDMGFSTLESNLNLLDNKFKFKLTNDGEVKYLTQKDINQVIIKRSNNKKSTYKLMDLKTVNIKGDIINLNKKAWLPFFEQGNINIFAYDVVQKQGGNYLFTVVYLNNPKDNFAINPIDFNRLNLFNMGKIDDKLIFVMKEIFRDCPQYIKKIDDSQTKFLEDSFKNGTEQRAELKKMQKEIKELPKTDRKQKEIELRRSFYIKPYIDMITEYNQTCSN